MFCFTYLCGLLLASVLVSYARLPVFISHDGKKTYPPRSPEPNVCMTPTCVIAAADILTSLDTTVDPCDDFYSFACGGWMKKHDVSEAEPEMHSFITTKQELDRKLRDLLESEYKSSDPPFVKKLKDYYNTCVDVDILEKQGSEILKEKLRLLGGGWPVVEGNQWDESSFNWVDSLISFRKLGFVYDILLGFYVLSDYRNEIVKIIYLLYPNMKRLPRANLTFSLDDSENVEYYHKMVKAAKLLGAEESTAEKELLEALEFEIACKKLIEMYQNDSEEERDTTVNSIAELQIELPQVPWLKLFNGLLLVERVYENETFVNYNPDLLAKLVDLITSTDKRVIANYMLWKAVLQSGSKLSEEWKNIQVDEEEKVSDKTSSKTSRWKRCLKDVKDNVDIALSSYYVRHYFSDGSKDEAMELAKYIHKEFLKLLESNDWMDDETRKKAQEKAKAIQKYIGYPDELLNDAFMTELYINLTITSDSYLENDLAILKWKNDIFFSTLRRTSKHDYVFREDLNTSLKRSYEIEFYNLMNVAASYSNYYNSIGIPAGILHDAFFDKERPKYMNFAEIGFVIGHEITHGFDTDGRYYDKDGEIVNWWDETSDENYIKKVKCIIDQYNNYTTFIGMKVNGERTQDENIADNGGMKEAYLAYHSWTNDHGIEPLLPGVNFTQDQIFWLSAARLWCAKTEPKRMKQKVIADMHSPKKFRVIGPMSNLAEFSRDFKCSADAPMNRKYKCEVW